LSGEIGEFKNINNQSGIGKSLIINMETNPNAKKNKTKPMIIIGNSKRLRILATEICFFFSCGCHINIPPQTFPKHFIK
ncbi:hypothetical protein ACPTFY_15310, partial [Enterococcus faecalis]|uniref:hypothetical protein n=1 Tax=Enterococcus faecalis TaxID=1351 RepID=UPI003CC5BA24